MKTNNSSATEIHSIDTFITALSEEDCANYMQLVRTCNLPKAAFEPFCSWSEDTYTRNCIVENEKFELILLCWEKGQVTPIHDHGGEECWVKIIEGEFRETIYKMSENKDFRAVTTRESEVGAISYMVDFMGFHRLENIANKRSISLHLYAKPIRNCQMFDEESKGIIRKELEYTTIFKKTTTLKE